MSAALHRHWFAFHRHPNWHGHCQHGYLGKRLVPFEHSCDRWHFHGPFKHRHTATGR